VAPCGTGKAVPPGVTRKCGALGRPMLAPLSLLCMRLYRRHTHNETIRDTRGDRHDTCHVLEDGQFFAMPAPRTRPRLGIHLLEKLGLHRLHPPVQCPVCTKCSTPAAGDHSPTRGRSPKDLDNLLQWIAAGAPTQQHGNGTCTKYHSALPRETGPRSKPSHACSGRSLSTRARPTSTSSTRTRARTLPHVMPLPDAS
jgi:hypothetical protein